MIELHRVAPPAMAAAHNRVREQLGPDSELEDVNLGPAIQLQEMPPLYWDGVEYPVGRISYSAGLKLQRALVLHRRFQEEPPVTLDSLRAQETWWEETLGLLWSLLEPKPERNPFADASPLEVGHLLGFTCLLLTKRNGSSRFRTSAPSLVTT